MHLNLAGNDLDQSVKGIIRRAKRPAHHFLEQITHGDFFYETIKLKSMLEESEEKW